MNTAGRARTIKAVVIAGLLTLDMGMAHFLSRQPAVQAWGVLFAVLPLSVIALLLLRQWLGSLVALLGLLLIGGLVVELFATLRHHIDWIYFLQNITVNLALGLWFGRSLTAHRQPLCTTFATLLHPAIHPRLAHYTYRVTQVWTAFFFLMAATSTLLFVLAPVGVWSTFANLLTLPLVVLMFLVEYAVRKRVLPPEDHLGLTSAFRAYRTLMTRRSPPGAPCKPDP